MGGFLQRFRPFSQDDNRTVVRDRNGGKGGTPIWVSGGSAVAVDNVTIGLNTLQQLMVKDGAITEDKIDPVLLSHLGVIYIADKVFATVADFTDPPGTDEWIVLVIADILADNGLWLLTGDGAGGSTSARFDVPIREGTLVMVRDTSAFGASGERSLWQQIEPGPIVVGTDPQTYERVGAATIYGDASNLPNARITDLRIYSSDGSAEIEATATTVDGHTVPTWDVIVPPLVSAPPLATTSYTNTGPIAATDRLVTIGTIIGPISLNLPSMGSFPAHIEMIIKDVRGTVSAINTVTLVASGLGFGTAGGGTTLPMTTAFQTMRLFHDGTLWYPII